MPFTFAHPSIILPLAKSANGRLSATGLIIGSMMPDFEYYLRFNLSSDISHTIFGLFFFCLPFGMYLAKAFHRVIRNPLIDALPQPLYERFAHYKDFDWKQYKRKRRWMIYACVLIGAASHLFWDGFTHERGFVANWFPFWANATADLGDWSIPLYKVMQHGGTLLGFGYIYLYIKRMPKYSQRNENTSYRASFWAVQVLFGFTYLVIWACIAEDIFGGDVVVAVIATSLLSLFTTACLFKYS